MWVLLYRDGSSPEIRDAGAVFNSKMTKSQAEAKRDEILNEVSARHASAPNPEITFGEFLEGVALPFLRSKWKRSTAETTENRIRVSTAIGVWGQSASIPDPEAATDVSAH
jgi:hypothetical protein